jgi:hypothetical protein
MRRIGLSVNGRPFRAPVLRDVGLERPGITVFHPHLRVVRPRKPERESVESGLRRRVREVEGVRALRPAVLTLMIDPPSSSNIRARATSRDGTARAFSVRLRGLAR